MAEVKDRFFIKVYKTATQGGVKFVDFLLAFMKCHCWGVDCCRKIMKIPTMSGPQQYQWGFDGEVKTGTWDEAIADYQLAKADGAVVTDTAPGSTNQPCTSC